MQATYKNQNLKKSSDGPLENSMVKKIIIHEDGLEDLEE